MAIKTFNIDSEVYRIFSEHCRKEGISMSKKVENFIKEEINKLKIETPKNIVPKEEHLRRYVG